VKVRNDQSFQFKASDRSLSPIAIKRVSILSLALFCFNAFQLLVLCNFMYRHW